MAKDTNDDKSPRRLKVYRANKSQDYIPVIEPGHEIAACDLKAMAAASEEGWNDGLAVRVILVDDKSGFNLTHLWMKPFYRLPNHSHDVDCAYYVVSGEAHMGNNILTAGDSFMVPADCFYTYSAGPEGAEVIEFRNDPDFTFRIGKHTKSHWNKVLEAARAHAAKWPDAVPPLAAARVAGRE